MIVLKIPCAAHNRDPLPHRPPSVPGAPSWGAPHAPARRTRTAFPAPLSPQPRTPGGCCRPAALGIIVIGLMVPINTLIARCGGIIRRKHMAVTDQRVKLNSEMLGACVSCVQLRRRLRACVLHPSAARRSLLVLRAKRY